MTKKAGSLESECYKNKASLTILFTAAEKKERAPLPQQFLQIYTNLHETLK